MIKRRNDLAKAINDSLRENSREIYDLKLKIMELETKLQREREKRERKQVLKDYDFAILVKDCNTILLEKGQQEKYITDYTLEQSSGNVPTIVYEKTLFPERRMK